MFKIKFCIINNKYFCVVCIGRLCNSAALQLKIYKFKISILVKYIFKKLTENDEIGMIEFNIIKDDINRAEITEFRVREKFRKKNIGKSLLTKGKTILVQYYNAKRLYVCPISDPYSNESCIPKKDLYSIYEKLGFQFKDTNSTLNTSDKQMYMQLK